MPSARIGRALGCAHELRAAFADPEDPEPPEFVEVPDRFLAEDYDPDELLGIIHAYAGQVTLLDTCLGALLELLAAHPVGQQTMLTVAGARGFPLGEHRRVGPCDEALYGELVHVPCFLRFPDGLGRAERSQALVEPADLWATLLAYFAVEPPRSLAGPRPLPLASGQQENIRDRLVLTGSGTERAILTPAWYLRVHDSSELFVRPDDLWHVNDVSSRCAEVVERLRVLLADDEAALRSGRALAEAPLEDVLRFGLD